MYCRMIPLGSKGGDQDKLMLVAVLPVTMTFTGSVGTAREMK